ncbi:retrovirus-related pol polyprotein from transposon TNT 1-94 [Tanacetum coccineum]
MEYKFRDQENSEYIFSFRSALEDFTCVVFVPDRNIKKHRGSYAYFAESGNCLFSSSTKWVIDSDASDHMTGQPKTGLQNARTAICLSTCFVHDTQPNITKLDPKSLKCVFLGYSRIQKGYRCYSPQLHCYLVSRDVTFHEDLPYFSVTTYRHQEENDNLLVYVSPTPVETTKQSTELDAPPLKLKDAPIDTPNDVTNDVSNDVSNDVPISAPSETYGESDAPSDAPNGSYSPPYSPAPELIYLLLFEKINALVDLPVYKKAIDCKWVFSVKMNPDGSIARLKARLVSKGYAQTYGIDYSKTFSPVTKISSIRLFISLAATYDWALHQLDVKNAFLHGDLEEEVYIEQPLGFVAQEEYGRVCKLKKALYGLKQSPRAWFRKFSNAVIEFGLRRSVYDHSIFYSSSNSGCILLVVYVDDIVITGSDKAKEIKVIYWHLLSDEGSQRKYCLDLLNDAGQIEAKPCDEPMIPKLKLKFEDGRFLHNPKKYRQVVRKLNYLTITHLDIAFLVSVVSQFLTAPRTSHWDAGNEYSLKDKKRSQNVQNQARDWKEHEKSKPETCSSKTGQPIKLIYEIKSP